MDASDIHILPMQPHHLEALQQDFEKNFPNIWTYAIWEEELGNTNSSYYILFYQDEPISLGGIKIVLDEADLMNIVTRLDYQKKGFAKLLLTYLISKAKEKKCKHITLEVASQNTIAIHLYEKMEFQKISIRKNYYRNGDDAIIMALSLS